MLLKYALKEFQWLCASEKKTTFALVKKLSKELGNFLRKVDAQRPTFTDCCFPSERLVYQVAQRHSIMNKHTYNIFTTLSKTLVEKLARYVAVVVRLLCPRAWLIISRGISLPCKVMAIVCRAV